MLDEIFYFALHEHHNDILSLSSRWSNPLVSSSQFDSQTNRATILAESLSGGHPQISLFWLSPTTVDIQAPEDAPEEAHVDLNDIIGLQEAVREPEHEVFANLFSEEPGLPDEDTMDDELTVTTTIIWEPPQVCLSLPCILQTDSPNSRTCLWMCLKPWCQTSTKLLLARSPQSVMTVTPDQPCTTPSDRVHTFTARSTVCTYVSRLSLFSLYCYRSVSALSGPSSHTIT